MKLNVFTKAIMCNKTMAQWLLLAFQLQLGSALSPFTHFSF